jgi:hypothetical protein
VDYNNDTGLPSVTDILSPYVDRRWFKKEHTDRGSACHDKMAAHVSFVPFFGQNWSPLWDPYIVSGKEWADANIKKVYLCEKRLSYPGSHTGQLDLVALLTSGLIAVVDWKTSVAESKTWKFQLAAYQDLVEKCTDIKIDTRIAVRLRRELGKKCLVNEYKDYAYDLGIFNCAKAVYNELGG